jgi:replication fork protection complex subunit Tof1/Swi1
MLTSFLVVKADSSARKIAMFKNGHLRLLMTLVGFRRIGEEDDPEGSWIVPSHLSADQLKESLDLVKEFEFSPPVFDDGQEAGDFIRRKPAGSTSRRKAVFDDEDDGIDDDDDEELLFPVGGPTAMKKSEALEALKKNRRRRRKEGSEDPEINHLSDEQLNVRAELRRQRELEKDRKIKSDLFVHDSDEETDEERDKIFYEQEAKLREKSKIAIMKELLGVGKDKESGPAATSRKRQSSALTGDSDDDDMLMAANRKRHSSFIPTASDDEGGLISAGSSSAARDNVLKESDNDTTDTPMSSPHVRSPQTKRRKVSGDESDSAHQSRKVNIVKIKTVIVAEDDDDEDISTVSRPTRQRVRAGFIVDSSDEE